MTHKIPNMVIMGAKEVENHTVTLRRYCTQEQVTMPRAEFVERVKRLNAERIMDNYKDIQI